MSVRRGSGEGSVLHIDASVLSSLLDSSFSVSGPCLDLSHPVFATLIGDDDDDVISTIELDASIDNGLALRFVAFSFGPHPVQSVFPEDILQRFVHVRRLTTSGLVGLFVDDFPDWVFSLLGLGEIVGESESISVGGIEEILNGDEGDLRGMSEVDRRDTEDAGDSGANDAGDAPHCRFILTKFKLVSMLRRRKRTLDISAKTDNPFTRGRVVKELIIGDDVDVSTASQVLNFDFSWSRVSSISPLSLLRRFSEVVEVNLLGTGLRVKPYWTHELVKLQGILFNISEWQRVDVGGIEATPDGGYRFLLTPDIAEVMMTRLSGCLNFNDALWHRDKCIQTVILEEIFSQDVKEKVKEIVFLGLGAGSSTWLRDAFTYYCVVVIRDVEAAEAYLYYVLEAEAEAPEAALKLSRFHIPGLVEIPEWTRTFPNLQWILMPEWNWHRTGLPLTDMILGDNDELCFNVTPRVIHDMAQFSEGFGGYIDLRQSKENRWTQGRQFSRLRVSVTSDDNEDEIITNVGLMKLTLQSLREFEGNFRFLHQIEEIWFDVDESSDDGDDKRVGENSSQLSGIPPWVKDMEGLQWIRIGGDNWVFLLNQWIFQEMTAESKNIALNQNTGAEWTQGKLIAKIMIMSDLDPATGEEVKSVNLNKNALDEFPSDLLAYVPGLRRFYASNNRLHWLPPRPPPGLSPDLDDLDLCQNYLSSIPFWLFQLPSLRNLNLAYNLVSSLDSEKEEDEEKDSKREDEEEREEDEEKDSKREDEEEREEDEEKDSKREDEEWEEDEEDNDSKEKVSSSPEDSRAISVVTSPTPSFDFVKPLSNFVNDCLEKLSLSNNRLHVLPAWIFTGLKKLRKLDVSFNEIVSLPDVKVGKVERLDPDDDVSEPPVVCECLEEVNFHSNRLSSVPSWFFSRASCPRLKKMNLCSNLLSTVPSGVLPAWGEGRLTDVHIYDNRIETIELAELKEFLKGLDERDGGGEIVEDQMDDSLTGIGYGNVDDDVGKEEAGFAHQEEDGLVEENVVVESGWEGHSRKSKKNVRKGRKGAKKDASRYAHGKGLTVFNRIRLQPNALFSPPFAVWKEGKDAVLSFIDESLLEREK